MATFDAILEPSEHTLTHTLSQATVQSPEEYWVELFSLFRQLLDESSESGDANDSAEESIDAELSELQFESSLDLADPWEDLQAEQEEEQESAEAEFSREWLIKKCRQSAHLTDEGITNVLAVLLSDASDDEIQDSLLNLLGFEQIEFVGTLVVHRKDVVRRISKKSSPNPTTSKLKPGMSSDVTVRVQSNKRKGNNLGTSQLFALAKSLLDLDGSTMHNGIGAALRGLDISHDDFPHIYLTSYGQRPLAVQKRKLDLVQGRSLTDTGKRHALPEGTIRTSEQGYDEVEIPRGEKHELEYDKLIKIADFKEEWVRGCFPGYKSLNAMQSLVFESAFTTNENLLICAPTGAGKTDIAMLSMLRCISDHIVPSQETHVIPIIKYSEFKIVYVAPMKALAAEIVSKFSKRLGGLGIQVRECTGDMQLTKSEIFATQVLVTTPEKWDVLTRKATRESELVSKVKLLIIDEVHLLHDERGAVLETIVARMQRSVEITQSMVRIVGLSATLPNFVDVAVFLKVNTRQGLFYFDGGFRPVPLKQHFIGVKGKAGSGIHNQTLSTLCYERSLALVADGKQVLVFVHSRNSTMRTVEDMQQVAQAEGAASIFSPTDHHLYGEFKREVERSKHRDLKRSLMEGFGFHHAGMMRSDRKMVEKWFEKGLIKVLSCTATLAWGVNLPAYAVVIKGTQLFDTQQGQFTDLSVLDVFQIFGRAGRPQYESEGVAYIMTSHEKLPKYLSAVTQQYPIESRFMDNLPDHLNAEISLGTVSSIEEGIQWLSYTYLFVRMKRNPLNYGIDWKGIDKDKRLVAARRKILVAAVQTLVRNQMITFDMNTGVLGSKDLGTIASNYYIKHESISLFNERLKERMTEADVLRTVSESAEFSNIRYRQEEDRELKRLYQNGCFCDIKGGPSSNPGKVNTIIQSMISRSTIEDSSIASDSNYISQNTGRILRALFEITLKRGWSHSCLMILSLCKAVDRKVWSFEHPLVQFEVSHEVADKLDGNMRGFDIMDIREMSPSEIGRALRLQKMGGAVLGYAHRFPMVNLEGSVAPLTNRVLQIELSVTPDFAWVDKIHGGAQSFWILAEDTDTGHLFHSEIFNCNKKNIGHATSIGFMIPLGESPPKQIIIRAVSDRWMGSETVLPLSFKHLILPQHESRHTDLLNLRPLPISALQSPAYEAIVGQKFRFFNPIQTQCFHALYETDANTLIGAPTGSGKTLAAELAIWRAFNKNSNGKIVYIAPLKALVRERVDDWRERMTNILGKRLVELTGDVTPDTGVLERTDIIITTPEKWDGISRAWQTRNYVRKVSLVIIDEIHLLGGDRGPILEVIISRLNFVSNSTNAKVRVVGLSTALANAGDLGRWLNVQSNSLFNFRHSVRPVPLTIHIDGFTGIHYCPRMATMNKPAFGAILEHSPDKPVLIFVSSRRQTRLTAQDLISLCAMSDNHRRFLRMTDDELNSIQSQIREQALRHSIAFGIGLHHAGLTDGDRKIVQELFVNQRIQVLVATSTLAWGVNTPAHLVIIKGTEYYDAKTKGYVDFPLTDVLQMMGRAGRPQYDDEGTACIFVHDVKKEFYKRFLHSPFPVESALHKNFDDHLNAEISSGTIRSAADAVEYLSWTYLFNRLPLNPAYYGLTDSSPDGVAKYLSRLVKTSLDELLGSSCVAVDDATCVVESTGSGKIAAFYYLSHHTLRLFHAELTADVQASDVLEVLSSATEFAELPVRHNEDILNRRLSEELPLPPISRNNWESPHVKTQLLLQCHFSRITGQVPITDYITDTVSILEQAVRVLQAMIAFSASMGNLATTLKVIELLQCVKQGRWPDDDPFLQLPGFTEDSIQEFPLRSKGKVLDCLPQVFEHSQGELKTAFGKLRGIDQEALKEIINVVARLPLFRAQVTSPDLIELRAVSEPVELNLIPTFDDAGDSAYQLALRIRRFEGLQGNKPSNLTRAYCPMFPKPQHESLILILGNPSTDQVIAVKRLPFQRNGVPQKQSSLTVRLKGKPGEVEHVRLFMCVDGYMGLDQAYDLSLTYERLE